MDGEEPRNAYPRAWLGATSNRWPHALSESKLKHQLSIILLTY